MSSWEKLNYENNFFAVAKGEVSDSSIVFISGRNSGVMTTDLPETVWNVAGSYPWSAWNGGNKALSVVSTSASDTASLVLNGLDSDYNPVTVVLTMNGLTPVVSSVSFYRLNSAVYLDDPNSNIGTISIKIGSQVGTTVGQIDPQMGNTSMSIYTVPAGHTAYSVYGDFSVNKNEGAQLNAMWRFYGTSFICVYATEVYQQHITTTPPGPGAIPEKSDIDNMIRFVTSNGTRVYSNQQLILVKNNALHV